MPLQELSIQITNKKPERGWRELLGDREVMSWCLYDWANSAFATTVMAGFFPVFFKQYWSAGADVTVSTHQLGSANSLAAAILAALSPILGAIADQGSAKKRFLALFSFLGIMTTGLLLMVAQGAWPAAILLYLLANIGFAGANTFYDALLISVARPRELTRVSSLGFAIGYLGGGILFALNVWMTLSPTTFGLSSATEAVKVSFVTVALWWAIFTLPTLFFVHETRSSRINYLHAAKSGLSQIRSTFRDLRKNRNIILFLISYFFYIDGVNTIMRMSVDYGLAIGLPSTSLITALLITQFVGFPAAIGVGQIAQRTGARAAIFLTISIYTAVTIFAFFMTTALHFYCLAIAIGLVQGGIQAISRSAFGLMVPKGKGGEYFGFFNMLGKFSSMLGPALVGWVALASKDSRLSILSVILLFLVGAAVLTRVKFPTCLYPDSLR